MNQIAMWLMVATMAAITVIGFIGFRRGPRILRRLIFAFLGLCSAIITTAIGIAAAQGKQFETTVSTMLSIVVSALLFGFMAWSMMTSPPPAPPGTGEEPRKGGCLRTLLALIGCALVGYLMIAALVIGIALMIGLVGYFSH